MRYRAMDANGDYVFTGSSLFLSNDAQTVAQAIGTRLRLFVGEWFLDKTVGLDKSRILGYGTATTRDREIQRCILETQGVQTILEYSSGVDQSRNFVVDATVQTIYGQTITISEIF